MQVHHELIAQVGEKLSAKNPLNITIDGFRRAAVALLLCDRGGKTTLAFTLRSDALPTHAGQISFPGGAKEDRDDSVFATATRETQEELGIDPTLITYVGQLDDVPTPSGFIIAPIVVDLDPSAAFQPDTREVASVFEAPLSFFTDPKNKVVHGEREFQEIVYKMVSYDFQGHTIWGATARMIDQLITSSQL